MKVILSIKPEFVEKIFIKEKKFEYRRKIFKRNVDSVIIYASSPIKAVVGEFTVEKILYYEINLLWEITKDKSGISKDYFYQYFKNVEKGFALKIKEVIPYDNPLSLTDLRIFYPPQSYIYIL